jgi:hypothetical protein
MKFQPLMALSLTHPYYRDGLCRDFWIEPTIATQSLLKNYRCVLKPLPHGLRILAPVTDDNTPFIPLPKGLTFVFQLRLQNPDFALFTDFTEISQVAAPLYTNADLGPGQEVQLVLVSRRAWATESFTVRQPATEDRYTLGGRPLAGLQLTDFTVESLGKIGKVMRYEAATKTITINSADARPGNVFRVTYATTPQQARDVLAEVEIHSNDSLPEITAGPGEFTIAFKAKKARWKYYIIADSSATQFYIEDKGTSPVIFSAENWTDLNQQPDPADDIAQTLAAQYPQLQRLRFVSDDLVPCQQAARESIQLRLNGNQVVGALPNPSLRNLSTFQGTKNGKPHQEEALFQMIKCFSH